MLSCRTVAILAAVLAGACSDQPADGYTWQRKYVPLTEYRWHVVGKEAITLWCGDAGRTVVNGCIYRLGEICHVYSTYTEEQAKAFKPAGTFGGTTLFQHEVWDDAATPTKGHCAGFEHVEPYLVYSRLY